MRIILTKGLSGMKTLAPISPSLANIRGDCGLQKRATYPRDEPSISYVRGGKPYEIYSVSSA